MIKIGTEQLTDAIMDGLNRYSEEVDEKMQKEIDDLSKEIVNDLKNDPVIPEKTGEYKKSFAVKKIAQGIGFKRNEVYSKKPYYRLTHLLEFGHALPQGGRTKAFPHWVKAQKEAETLPERIKRRLEE